MHTELSHTPGILYAIAYWLSAMLYCRFLPERVKGMKRRLIAAFFFVLLCGFMTLTDHPPVYLFFLFISIEIGMIYLLMYLLCDMPPGKTVYYCARAFMLGELATSLGWLLYFYSVTRLGARASLPFMCALMAAVYAVVFGVSFWDYAAEVLPIFDKCLFIEWFRLVSLVESGHDISCDVITLVGIKNIVALLGEDE